MTLLIVEHDNADLGEAFAKLNDKVGGVVKKAAEEAASTAAASIAGAAVGSVVPGVGPVIGAAVGIAVEAAAAAIVDGLANEAFTPKTLVLKIENPEQLKQHPSLGQAQTIEVTEHGAKYLIEYDWNVVVSAADPFAIQNQDGRIEVFVRGLKDGAIWHRWQTAPNGPFADWHSLGGSFTQPFAIRNQDGRIELFAIGAGSDRALWHRWQTAPNGPFAEWHSLSGDFTEPFAIQNQDGRIEVFVRGLRDGAIWHRWQTAPNSSFGDWHQAK